MRGVERNETGIGYSFAPSRIFAARAKIVDPERVDTPLGQHDEGGDGAEARAIDAGREAFEEQARAQAKGVSVKIVRRKDYASREKFEAALARAVEEAQPDLVVLAGFMRLLGPAFLDRFPGRVINIHPSLLPAFPGLEAQKQALEYGVKFTGCSVHYVDYGMDSGRIIDQRVVAVMPDDNVQSLSARILVHEHELLVDVIRRLGEQMTEPTGEGGCVCGEQ